MLKRIIFILFVLVSISSCKKDVIETEPKLSLNGNTINFNSDKQIKNIEVFTNLKDWEVISSQPEWCKVTKDNSSKTQISILVLENENTDERKATITVSGGSLSSSVEVTQIGTKPTIKLSTDSIYFSYKSSERVIKVTTNIERYDVRVSEDTDWLIIEKDESVADQYKISVSENKDISERKVLITFESAKPIESSANEELLVTQMYDKGTSDDIEVPKDTKVIPTSGKANQEHPGQGIENTFNGVFGGEPYHSPWGDGTKFPVVLEYFFDGYDTSPEIIDYLIYYTRSGNGNFGEFNLYVSTKEYPEYTLYGNYDFKQVNSPSRITFKDGLKNPLKIKFEVLSGLGGYASCDQMEFYEINRNDELKNDLLSVFTDMSCSELLKGVTIDQINSIPRFFGNIAMELFNESYPNDFRIAEYPAYSKVESWADKLLINPQGIFDNCTGVYAEEGEELVVLVSDTHGHQITLSSVPETDTYDRDDYVLNEGINKIDIKRTGLLYILYFVDDLSDTDSKPIKIHFPIQSGTVNGYWSLDEHKTDEKYVELLNSSTYKYFEVKGENTIIKIPRASFKQVVPNSILPTINLWDEMIQVQHELMGIDKLYPIQMNNRMYARSTKDGYMSAQSYQINFAENTLYKILPPSEIFKDEDNIWGPAHEIGHMYQGAVNWKGNTETSNNLFSNLVRHKMTDFNSRGETMEEINQWNIVDKRVFTDYGGNIGIPSLRMQWQLYCYFHILEKDKSFFPNLFDISRQMGKRPIDSDPGWSQLNYVRNASDAAKLNLLDFFEFWGFLTPINMEVDQYGKGQLIVTQQMIDETREYVNNKGYNKPSHVIQYIEDRDSKSYGDVGKLKQQYKQNLKITKEVTYSKSGNKVSIRNGVEAVGFEVRENGILKFFSNKFEFTLPNELWNDNCMIYAVQADGTKIEVDF